MLIINHLISALSRRAGDEAVDLDAALEAVKFQYPGLDDDDPSVRHRVLAQQQTDVMFRYVSHEEAVLHSTYVIMS